MPLYKPAMPVSVGQPTTIIISMAWPQTAIVRVLATGPNFVEGAGPIWCTRRLPVSHNVQLFRLNLHFEKMPTYAMNSDFPRV